MSRGWLQEEIQRDSIAPLHFIKLNSADSSHGEQEPPVGFPSVTLVSVTPSQRRKPAVVKQSLRGWGRFSQDEAERTLLCRPILSPAPPLPSRCRLMAAEKKTAGEGRDEESAGSLPPSPSVSSDLGSSPRSTFSTALLEKKSLWQYEALFAYVDCQGSFASC